LSTLAATSDKIFVNVSCYQCEVIRTPNREIHQKKTQVILAIRTKVSKQAATRIKRSKIKEAHTSQESYGKAFHRRGAAHPEVEQVWRQFVHTSVFFRWIQVVNLCKDVHESRKTKRETMTVLHQCDA
jgi:hypothetical protein